MTTTSEVLLYARDLIAQGYCKNTLAQDAKGRDVSPSSPDARSWCQAGAIALATRTLGWVGKSPRTYPAHYLTIVIAGQHRVVWNNAPERTQAEVVEAFDAAARLAKEAGD